MALSFKRRRQTKGGKGTAKVEKANHWGARCNGQKKPPTGKLMDG